MILEKVYDELISQIEDLKKAIAGGAGGSKDYDKLDNRPKVNNITLTGNKKSSDLKIAYSMTEAEYAAATKNTESIYCLQENAGTITDSAYVNLEVADWTEVSGVYKQTKPFVFEVTPAAGWTIEDVSIETGIATIDSYEVTEDPFGLSITYAAETLPEYGITATVTVTINQPAGSTRIVKNGLQFGGRTVTEIYSGSTDVSSYEMTQAFTNFDELVIQATTVLTGTTYHLYSTCPVSLLAADILSGARTGICSDDGFIYFTVTDTTHFAKAQNKSFYITKILGIKY